jgi:23S rRNA pseudouridine1911/1915/1917 synthase
LIVCVKNDAAWQHLADQFKAHTVRKEYLALVKGKLLPEQGTIKSSIGRDPDNRKRMAVVEEGKEAVTEYRVIKYLDDLSLLEVCLRTGRTHQIRVHLTAIGHPVIGDTVYGTRSPYVGRQFLHAHRLGFCLPSTGIYREFVSQLPPDLEQCLNLLDARPARSTHRRHPGKISGQPAQMFAAKHDICYHHLLNQPPLPGQEDKDEIF